MCVPEKQRWSKSDQLVTKNKVLFTVAVWQKAKPQGCVMFRPLKAALESSYLSLSNGNVRDEDVPGLCDDDDQLFPSSFTIFLVNDHVSI